MTAIATELKELIDEYLAALLLVKVDDLKYKPLPEKWSKKEQIGHLIDSAENNIRRFITAQYEENPMIIYNQDKWVALNDYQQWDTDELIELWYLLNKQIIFILENIDVDVSKRICNTGATQNIEWLAKDYIKHLKHHMHQVLIMEPVPYP